MLVVRLLGSQSVVDAANGTIATRSARTLALIGLLVARTGVPQDRAAIAGAFWPESGDPQALTNLRRELHQLRHLLGTSDDSLEITSTQICWHEKHLHDIDLATFLREDRLAQAETNPATIVEHGTSAIEAYAGPLLPGLDEQWLDDLREEIRGRCLALCDRVSRAAADGGRVDVVVSALRKLISIDRYDERAHRKLMRAYAAQGDRARAIGTYHRLATTLEGDLGVAPDRRTTAVLAELRGPADGPVSPRPTHAPGNPVSESSHPDLYWAIRGGGGNFGVVTSFTFRCHPIGENGVIIGGPVLYDIADAGEVLRWFAQTQPTLPEDLGGWLGLITIPPAPPFPEELWGRKACAIVWCYSGPHAQADEVLAPVKSFGQPLIVGLQPMPYSALTAAFNDLFPPGL
jgi:DNA-binding SARP family transcriptional activator